MFSNKLARNSIFIWVGLFICAFIAQINLGNSSNTPAPTISESQKNLIQNAVVPIFLSEDKMAPVSQLQSLIQDTDIEQIKVYSSDRQLIADILNSKAPESTNTNIIDSFPVTFQGTLAGSVQIEVVDTAEYQSFIGNLVPVFIRSLIISLTAVAFVGIYLVLNKQFVSKLAGNHRKVDLLEPEAKMGIGNQGSSLLLYIYPLAEETLQANEIALKECMASFYRKLENHLLLYGGRVISLSNERIICRMPMGQSTNDHQQALIFTWGMARIFLFKFEHSQYQLKIKTLLHKTSSAAKSGQLYRAISEIGSTTEGDIIKSKDHAHISENLLNSFSQSDFAYQALNKDLGIYRISTIKKSLETLWQRQESMVVAANS